MQGMCLQELLSVIARQAQDCFCILGFCATDPNVKGSRTEAYADMINRDRRRWEKADRDKDGRLSKEEFMDFLHPEDTEHMRDIVVMVSIIVCVCG